MAPSEDPRDWRASLKDASLETSAGEKLAHPQKAIPPAHVTFVIDCARGKQLSVAAPPGPRQVPRPHQGPVTLPMKTYIVFCGETRPPSVGDTLVSGGHLAQAKDTLSLHREVVAEASLPASPPYPPDVPRAKGSPWKAGPARSSTWGTVKGSLKALSSCVCGQAD